ncbi:hypothetical protein M0R19_07495 [Candidatus Pacearchaeota archaeon]|nr:hypothetical protein [Candidatus Pacearchaeota archaeon]
MENEKSNRNFICKICGREMSIKCIGGHLTKTHKITLEDYYNKFFRKDEKEGICKTCGGKVKFRNLAVGYPEFCSVKCSSNNKDTIEKRENSCLEKYGNKNVNRCKEIRDKIEKTCIERYGCKTILQNEEEKERIKKINLEKYGVENVSQIKEVKEKKKQRSLEKYGTEYVFQSEEIKESIKKTCMERYGVEYAMQSEEVKEKVNETFRKKYGDHPFKVKEFRDNIKKIFMEKYGSESFVESQEFRKRNIEKFVNKYKDWYDKYKQLVPDCDTFDELIFNKNGLVNLTCKNCGLKYTRKAPRSLCCPKCHRSYLEQEMELFLRSIGVENIVLNTRKIISPYEIDLFLPDYNIGIEMHGLLCHSEFFAIRKLCKKNIPEVLKKMKKKLSLHYIKFKECSNKKIKLIQIFEDEWYNKREIVESRIKYALNKIENSIHARKCEIKEIGSRDSNVFLEDNHIQGRDTSSIHIGAYYKTELVSVMTFSKPSIAKGGDPNSKAFEISRFASKLNTNISGMANRLFKYFVEKYNPISVFTYADARWSSGDIYLKMGFEYKKWTGLNYWYTDGFDRWHRFRFRKGKDDPKDMPEWMIRGFQGLYRIWDCGHYKFEKIFRKE